MKLTVVIAVEVEADDSTSPEDVAAAIAPWRDQVEHTLAARGVKTRGAVVRAVSASADALAMALEVRRG